MLLEELNEYCVTAMGKASFFLKCGKIYVI